MNDIALNYEYLIRRAFQCGRYEVPGAMILNEQIEEEIKSGEYKIIEE